jgi:peptide chain release factor 3
MQPELCPRLPVAKTVATETSRRRTFAIISHPDAGKTTLTEKLLLYAGAVELAGAVRPKKNRQHAASDWMALEQARGISITSTALQFEYRGCVFNLLDTPGHQDFSEDTYRTLTAVDSAVMVLDAAKGIEPQTRKLFQVCRLRGIPILTFVNKMDQPVRDPLAILDEIESELQIVPAPMNWPVGEGRAFQGVFDRASRRLLRFSRFSRGQTQSEYWESTLDDPEFRDSIGSNEYAHLRESLDLLEAAGASFAVETFMKGDLTPVYFGSALNNFGVEGFLNALVELGPPPQPRRSTGGLVYPDDQAFSGFVFKIQANMDPQHRDSMAFLRICSGRFERDMLVHHPRLGKRIRMTHLHRLFARERTTIDEAWPGDVVGVVNPGTFAIGDTLSAGAPIEFDPLPIFPPEFFATLRNIDMAKSKQFRKGVDQLSEEGVVQVYYSPEGVRREPILGAVGKLQFDVVESRMKEEYGVSATADPLPYTLARWIRASEENIRRVRWPSTGMLQVRDRKGSLVCLFSSIWELNYLQREYPDVTFSEIG